MHFKIPLVNAINFAIFFGILTYHLNNLGESPIFVSSMWANTLIWLVIGFGLGVIINLMFKKHPEGDHKHKMPDKVSSKLIIIPSVLLVILIAVFALFFAGYNPFTAEGQSVKETEETNETTEEVEPEEPEIEYDGRCEERSHERVYVEEAGDYTSMEKWKKLKYKCNTQGDCINAILDDDEFYEDESDIRCNTTLS